MLMIHNNQTSKRSQDIVKEFTEKFSFRKVFEKIINNKDESLIPILTANIAIFAISSTIVFSSSGDTLTASLLLIFISAILGLLGVLLNIWYLIRLKTRLDFFSKEQEKIYDKAEANIARTFDLFEKIIKLSSDKKEGNFKENNESTHEISKKLKSYTQADLVAEEGVFIPLLIMELSVIETKMNITKCLDAPLEEEYAGLKLFIDRVSDKFKNWSLVLSSAFILGALLVKFLVG